MTFIITMIITMIPIMTVIINMIAIMTVIIITNTVHYHYQYDYQYHHHIPTHYYDQYLIHYHTLTLSLLFPPYAYHGRCLPSQTDSAAAAGLKSCARSPYLLIPPQF